AAGDHARADHLREQRLEQAAQLGVATHHGGQWAAPAVDGKAAILSTDLGHSAELLEHRGPGRRALPDSAARRGPPQRHLSADRAQRVLELLGREPLSEQLEQPLEYRCVATWEQ